MPPMFFPEYEGLTFAIEAGSMTDANEVAELIREAQRWEKTSAGN